MYVDTGSNLMDTPLMALMVLPNLSFVNSLIVHHLGIREQGDVHRMVRMVVANEDVSHLFRGEPLFAQPFQDQCSIRDHPRVGHYNSVIAPYKRASASNFERTGQLSLASVPFDENGNFIHGIPLLSHQGLASLPGVLT